MTSPRICIIDDQIAFIRLCERILTSEGYACETVRDLGSAQKEVAASQPEVVVLDIRLGAEADGLNILVELSTDERTRRIPIVICTASRDLLITHQALIEELGCEIVEKPFDVETFVSAIQRCLESTHSAEPGAPMLR